MSTSTAATQRNRQLWLAYAGGCLLTWLLFVLGVTEFQPGLWQFWEAMYQASLSLWPPMLLGLGVWPWLGWLNRRPRPLWELCALHLAGALLFGTAWQMLDYGMALCLFGNAHAQAMLAQSILWRALWGALVYLALLTAFSAVLNARRAKQLELAQVQAESALARAELSAISGKLNPHFLFNTLNSLIALTRKDAKAAEQGLLRFAGMLRYVLAEKREATERVALQEELAFVRDYLALEALRLGPRLRVSWQLDPQTLLDEIPPLSLQPLVENCVRHGIAPLPQGGEIVISAQRDAMTQALQLCVRDDGQGCEPGQAERQAQPGSSGGVGLSALRRRFALDFEGRARMQIHTAPGQGFRVDLWIPQT
ncbi:anti-sigma regulatory factor (Ser/Thr protein kinase) [Paucibacter oligotrophus]|uniref:Anti-sigma regulatory factor (Ser/Thr protein kinase) n=1 Tax=Roseateles oligotrophus TaxID=1769250 RepID=A0A840L7U5_9BURK|nr:histidine kinase [Roseateles oligotrophus]MBB4842735.1 anti-sigma regulatory factor (Ser/Thr protein kinase) [Roseateles oligotrophus]